MACSDRVALAVGALISAICLVKMPPPGGIGAAPPCRLEGDRLPGAAGAAAGAPPVVPFYARLALTSAALLWLSFTRWWEEWRVWAVAALRLSLFFGPISTKWLLCSAPGSSLIDGVRVLMGESSSS